MKYTNKRPKAKLGGEGKEDTYNTMSTELIDTDDLGMAALPTDGGSHLPDPTHNVSATGWPTCALYVCKCLQVRLTIPPGVVSLSLLKAAFPEGYYIEWARQYISTCPAHQVGPDSASCEGHRVDAVANNSVSETLRACAQCRPSQIEVKVLQLHKEVAGFVQGPVGSYTVFVAWVVVKPQRHTTNTQTPSLLTCLPGSWSIQVVAGIQASSLAKSALGTKSGDNWANIP